MNALDARDPRARIDALHDEAEELAEAARGAVGDARKRLLDRATAKVRQAARERAFHGVDS